MIPLSSSIKNMNVADVLRVGAMYAGDTISLNSTKGFKMSDANSDIASSYINAGKKLEFKTTGMEFATEMIAEARRKELRIGQVTVTLRKSRYARTVKLRTVRDGLRHLIYIVQNG